MKSRRKASYWMISMRILWIERLIQLVKMKVHSVKYATVIIKKATFSRLNVGIVTVSTAKAIIFESRSPMAKLWSYHVCSLAARKCILSNRYKNSAVPRSKSNTRWLKKMFVLVNLESLSGVHVQDVNLLSLGLAVASDARPSVSAASPPASSVVTHTMKRHAKSQARLASLFII